MDSIVNSIVNNIGKGTFKTFLYVFVISMFWIVTFYLFKPEIFDEKLIILIPLLFSLSFMWFVLYFLAIFQLEYFIRYFKDEYLEQLSTTRVEVYTTSSLILKSFYILYGFYYTIPLTLYLRISFISGIILFSICGLLVRIKIVQGKQHIRKLKEIGELR